MKSDLYNDNDQKFEKLIKDLQNLPKVKADDNFEFNLMTKIQNGQFESNLEKKERSRFSWTLIPSAALALSAFILFFIISDSSSDIENPFSVAPQLRGNIASQIEDTINQKKSAEKEFINTQKSSEANKLAQESIKQQLAKGRNLPVDNFINESPTQMKNSLGGTQIVSQSNSRNPNSVYIRVDDSKEKIEKNKAKLDSLKKVMKKEDIDKR